MSTTRIRDNLPQFGANALMVFDRAMGEAAAEGARLSVLQAPHLHGHLRSSNRVERKGLMHFEVSYNASYAAYQERGMRKDGTHVIRKHTEPGTKTHYLRDPMMLVTSPSRFNARLKAAGQSVKV